MRTQLRLCVTVFCATMAAVVFADTSGTVAAPATSQPQAATEDTSPLLTVHVSGDTVIGDEDSMHIEVTGNVRILAYTDDPDSPRLAVRAEGVRLDLEAKSVHAEGSVLMRTEAAQFRGSDLSYNMKTDELHMTDAAAGYEFELAGGRTMRGFFFGNQISRTANELVIVKGTVTPCDDPESPVIGAGAQRLVYNSTTGKVTVYGGALHFLGMRIPMFPKFSFYHGGDEEAGAPEIMLPGYSSYDGLYIPLAYEFTREGSPWLGTATVRMGTRAHPRGTVSMVTANPREQLGIHGTYDELLTDDITRRLVLSRLPEVRYTRQWGGARTTPGAPGDWEVGLSAGRYRERTQDDPPPAYTDSRIAAWLEYTAHREQKRTLTGTWWGTGVTQSYYDEGDQFSDISVEAGAGGRLTENVKGSLTLTHHFLGGQSPFEFDDVDIKTEAYGTLKLTCGDWWGLSGDARYDLDASSLRDYSLWLSRRTRYLTWSLGYDFSSKNVGVRVDINGLTGDTLPPETRPLISDDEVGLTPEWVHEGAVVDF